MKKYVIRMSAIVASVFMLAGCEVNKEDTQKISYESKTSMSSVSDSSSAKKISSSTERLEKEEKKEIKKKTQQKSNNDINTELASKEFEGAQTIIINDNQPGFTDKELSLSNGAWENYGDLDELNRATSAEAMLNQSIMPTKKRGSISDVKPTGWKNKKIKSGYLYNRSHLIGHALAGEDANWKNLITGTQQLNNPEMLRHEMDVNHYLKKSKDNYVRYSVTPIFKDDELLVRGVSMRAQSIGSDAILFNVYIFNVQDGITLNYSDGSSEISESERSENSIPEKKEAQTTVPESVEEQATPSEANNDSTGTVYVTPTGKKYHVKSHGRGNFSPATLEEAKNMGLTPCDVCY